MRIPDGTIGDAGRLKHLSDEEQRKALVEEIRHGGEREAPVMRPTPAPASAPDGIFDPAALTAVIPYRSERYRMPDGKWVWVHPLSMADYAFISRQVSKDLRRLGLVQEGLSRTAAIDQAKEAAMEAQSRGAVWTVVCCCRQGEAPSAPVIFQLSHADELRKNPGWAKAVEEIAALAEALANGQSETALLRELMTGFFGRMGSWLTTLHGQLSSAVGTSSEMDPKAASALFQAGLAQLEDFAGSVSSLNVQAQQEARPYRPIDLQALAMHFEEATP